MAEDQHKRETFLIPGYHRRTVRETLRHIFWRLISPLPDRPYLILKYWSIVGRRPDLRRPQTFTEKCQVRKLYDRDPLYPKLVDKAGAKQLIDDKLGKNYAVPAFWIGTDLSSVEWDNVPLPAVVKPTHASSQGRFLYSRADIDALLAENPVADWLALDHSGYNREWAYSQVKPQVVIEKMLLVDGGVPWDYRLFTFAGKVSHIEIDIRIDGRGYSCNYSPDWQKLPFYDPDYLTLFPGDVRRPERLAEMIEVAEALGRDLDFVRVDLYVSDDWVYVGELTLYPGGGFERFEPPQYDRIIGDKWQLGFKLPA